MTTRIKALALAAALGSAVIVPSLALPSLAQADGWRGSGPCTAQQMGGGFGGHHMMGGYYRDQHMMGSGVGPQMDGPRMERMEERFGEMDADKDGKVTPAELAAYHAARFAAADTDGDGKLSAAEMDAARAAKRQERIARMIAWHDTDGDGLLSAEEMPNRGAGRMMHIDRDGDGAVSIEEMKAGPRFFGPKR